MTFFIKIFDSFLIQNIIWSVQLQIRLNYESYLDTPNYISS